MNHADTISIDQGIGVVASNGSMQVSPTSTTTYTLTAVNTAGQVTNTTTLVVTGGFDPPTINSFTATPSSISAGNSSTLQWNVTNANTVTIDQSIGDVMPSGSRSVQPVANTTYTLVATNGFGTRSATVTVTVVSGVRIVSFTAEPDSLRRGEKSTLTWNTTGAVSVVLNPGNMTVPLNGTMDVMPEETTEYSIKATGSQGQFTSAVRLVSVFDTDIELTLDEDELDFGELTESLTVDLSVNNVSAIDFTVTKKPDWLTLNPEEGVIGELPVRITVVPDRKEMYPGQRLSAEVEFSAAGVPPVSLFVDVAKREQPERGVSLFFPGVVVDGDHQSVIRLVNADQTTGKLDIQIFNQYGELESMTRNIHFPPNGSYQRELPVMETDTGWVVVTANFSDGEPGLRKVHGILVTRTLDGEEIVATSPTRMAQETLFVPHIAKDPSFYTQSSISNLSPEAVMDFESPQIGTLMVGDADNGEQLNFDFRTLMGGTITGPGWGELVLDNNRPRMAGIEVFGREKSTGLRQAVGVALDGEAGNDLIFAHIAKDVANFWTGVVIINSSNQESMVSITSTDSTGQLIGTFEETYAPFEKKTYLVTASSVPFGTDSAWVRVQSSAPLVGYELFGTYDDRFAGFESVRALATSCAVSHLEDTVTSGGWTGLAIVNPNQESATLTLTLNSRLGVQKETTTQQVTAGNKLVALASNLFTSNFEAGDWILVHSDLPVAGFELFGYERKTLAAVLINLE